MVYFDFNIFLKMYSSVNGSVHVHTECVCLTCVDTIMSFEIVIADKGFITFIAFVRLFPCVPERMTWQLCGCLESLVTAFHITLVRFLFLMHSAMNSVKTKINYNCRIQTEQYSLQTGKGTASILPKFTTYMHQCLCFPPIGPWQAKNLHVHVLHVQYSVGGNWVSYRPST